MLVSNIFISTAHAALDTAAFGRAVNPVINEIVNPIILFIFGLAVLFFVYGVVQMIMHADDPTARATGRNHMLYGAIGMFIMISAWGIIGLISNTLKGVKSNATSGNTINSAPLQINNSPIF